MPTTKRKNPKHLQLDVQTFSGFNNGSQADVDAAVKKALETYMQQADKDGKKIFGQPVAHPQLNFNKKLDVIIRAFVKPQRRRNERTPPTSSRRLRGSAK